MTFLTSLVLTEAETVAEPRPPTTTTSGLTPNHRIRASGTYGRRPSAVGVGVGVGVGVADGVGVGVDVTGSA
ncbi:hypothetical protein Mame01_33290 [Microbispora amethystogenes]|nr:hypothetical protein Mame01_33290 [Microbispora amethystogenes]